MRIPVPDELLPADRLGRVHFTGIGGAGLSGIARIMARRGIEVSGSDDNETPFLAPLRELGVRCHLGYDATQVADADTVVVTTAAREDNPEVLEAAARGLRMLPRSAGLQSVMQGRRVVAVAGTHGKTTATSLLTVALLHCGAAPSYAIGGILRATGRNADAGDGELFVAEADESDGAFLVYSPYAAIVTNVEPDHLDVWRTPEAYRQGFVDFLDRIDPDGFVVCCVDDPGAAQLAGVARERGLEVLTVAVDAEADLRLEDLAFAGTDSSATVRQGEQVLGRLQLQIPGRHYLIDAAAALATGLRLGFSFDELSAGLASFTGTGRRMEPQGDVGGVRIFDSYAHHPQEIASDLDAARGIAGSGRVIAAFQPHLVSRVRMLGAEMGQALGAADEVLVLDVYVAREEPDPEVTGRLVADAVPLPADRVAYVSTDELPAQVADRARPGDVVVTLGAGNINALLPAILTALAAEGADAAVRQDGPDGG